jgi:antitoxin ParD1/3/4
LNPQLARFVEQQVNAGRFSTPDDVVNGALARLQAEKELAETDADALRAQIAVGIEQADRGELTPWDPTAIEAEVDRRAREDEAVEDGPNKR